ncbi:MAG TPA: EF-hand domain-containing protein [Chthoniobacter sp.]|nr:EF-hand domain-containing protein [Chthoniobacter sp.]
MTASLRKFAVWCLAWAALLPHASAHRIDEYLQATLVIIEPGSIRLEINLTPGTDVAAAVLAQIDRNGDGVISAEETNAYGEALKRDLAVALDDRPVDLKLASAQCPSVDELRSGSGIVQIVFTVPPGVLTAQPHRLEIHNRHLPAMSVYLLNAGQPQFFNTAPPEAGSIEITAQKRSVNQDTGTIEFIFRPGANASAK